MKKLLLAILVISSSAFGVSCTTKSSEKVPGKISGEIKVGADLAAKLKNTDVLYIIARSQQSGPPSAVKRIQHPSFPLKYVIGPEDAMVPGMAGGFGNGSNMTVTARISRTGNAMPSAGDLEGVFGGNPAHPGDNGVDIVIDRERN